MKNPIKYLGIIPARKGSKRIHGKNTKLFAGKPLVEWSILSAKKAHLDEIFVSTDSAEIMNIALSNQVLCPELRPEYLSSDLSSSFDVVEHVLNFFFTKGITVENIVLLQPTSPLRTSDDINAAIDLYEKRQHAPVQSYSLAECPPEWCCRINEDLTLQENQIGKRTSQEVGPTYRINGAIYIIKAKDLLLEKKFVPARSTAFIMPRERGIDIDEEIDFKFAEFLMKESNL